MTRCSPASRHGCRLTTATALILTFLTVTLPAGAIDYTWQTTLRTEWAGNIDTGRDQSLRLDLSPQLDLSLGDSVELTAIGRLRTEDNNTAGFDHLSLSAFDQITRPQIIGDSTAATLRELYIATEISGIHLTLGKQQVVWGEADGLKVLDIVNPQSFQYFILEEFEQSRIPTWMVNLETVVAGWDTQFLWIPDQTYHALPEDGSTWAFSSPQLVPSAAGLAPNTTVRMDKTDKPGKNIRDADTGLRLANNWRGWDFSLNYFYHYDDLPVLHRRATPGPSPGIVLTPKYHRTHTFGGTANNAFGDWVLRTEVGYSTDRYLLSNDVGNTDGITKGNEIAYVLGLDWSGLSNTLISAQLFQSHFSENNSVRDKKEANATLLAQRLFWNDTLTLEVIWLGSLNSGDGLLRPKISYEWQDDFKTWVGSDIFYGDKTGLFGQFHHNDQLSIGVEVDF